MRLTIVNYTTKRVYQLTSIPSQEYIDSGYKGIWEDWLTDSIDPNVWTSRDCYFMIHNDLDVEMIDTNDEGSYISRNPQPNEIRYKGHIHNDY